MRRVEHMLVVCALAVQVAWPAAARAAPVGGSIRVVAAGPGDQAGASLDAHLGVFTDRDGSVSRVMLVDLATDALQVVAAGPAADQPDLARNVVAHRTPEGIALRFALTGALLRAPAEPGAASPTVSATTAAWELGPAGSRDIGWYQLVSGTSGILAAPGDQRAPSAAGNIVAYVDDAAGGRVLLRDLARSETRVVCEGAASSTSVAGAGDAVRVAVARAAPGSDANIEVWDGAGNLVAELDEPGEQRAPRLSPPWIAFEDLSLGRVQVVLWNYTTGLAYLPRASTPAQALGDLEVSLSELALAFSESNGTDLDLFLYSLPVPVEDDGTGGNWPPKPPPVPPARCDDAQPTVLATLALGRDEAATEAGEVSFSLGDGKDMPVLVCIDEIGVKEAWVAVDGAVVASPADFAPVSAHVEARRVARGGEALVSVVMAARQGSRLWLRVLADPGSIPVTSVTPGDPPLTPPGGTPAAWNPEPRALEATTGCGAGPAGPLGLLLLAAQLATRRPRRQC